MGCGASHSTVAADSSAKPDRKHSHSHTHTATNNSEKTKHDSNRRNGGGGGGGGGELGADLGALNVTSTSYEESLSSSQPLSPLSMKNPVYNYLKHVSVEDVIDLNDDLLTVKSTQTILSVAEALAHANLLSAPVVDSKNHCVGFIDVLDIVVYVAHEGETVLSNATNKMAVMMDLRRDFTTWKFRGVDVGARSVTDVMNFFSAPMKVESIRLSDRLSAAMHTFVKDIRRMPVVDDNGVLVSLLTQKHVLNVIRDAPPSPAVQNFLEQTLAEMGYDRADEIITIDKSAQMLETLRLFHSEFVWSVTVTDEEDGDGCLFGCISSALFRGLKVSEFDLLLMDVQTALETRSFQDDKVRTVEQSTTLSEVLTALIDAVHHRVWICEGNSPVQIVSTTDLLRFLSYPDINALSDFALSS